MTGKKFLPRLRFWFWVLLFATYSVTAAAVMIHALVGADHGELSQVTVTTVESPPEARIGGAAQLPGVFRAQRGPPCCGLPPASAFQVTWPDGCSEDVTVVSQSAPAGVRLLPGTQMGAPDAMAPAGELELVPVADEGRVARD